MSVRPAQPADLAAISGIARSCPFCAAWSLEAYGSEIVRLGSWVLLWDDGEVRGFVLARKVMDEAQILDLAVRPGDQRKGVGRSLLEALAERAADSGCVKLSLEVDAGNASALAFYRDTGYAVVGRRRKFYNSTADAVLMDRILR